MSTLKPKYTLFDGIQQMLAPETLSDLIAHPVRRVEIQPMNGHSGLAGGQLSYVDTDAGRFVLKRMSVASDWIMFASNDFRCRSVTLWQYGLLDRLLPHLEHKILAGARDCEGWAILMDDLTGHVYSWDSPMPPGLAPVFLDQLARIHAAFWNNPQLKDPRLGLCSLEQLLNQTSLPMTQKYQHLTMGVIPEWVRDGWKVMEELLDRDVFLAMQNLSEAPQPLFDALSGYPFTLLHGDYRSENLAHPNHPVALDWQESTCSLMTIDLAWFAKNGYVRDTFGEAQAIRYYRERLESNLKGAFDDLEWQAMVDLGYLVDALRSTCFAAYWYEHADREESRQWNEQAIRRRNQQVRDALRWLQ